MVIGGLSRIINELPESTNSLSDESQLKNKKIKKRKKYREKQKELYRLTKAI